MELIRRSVWARWTTATSLTSSPGPQNGCSSCFQREGLNSWANLYSSDGSENGAPALKWRGESGGEGGLLGTHLPVGETNANHLLSNHRLAIQHLAERDPVSDAVSAVPDSEDDNQTLFSPDTNRHRPSLPLKTSEDKTFDHVLETVLETFLSFPVLHEDLSLSAVTITSLWTSTFSAPAPSLTG